MTFTQIVKDIFTKTSKEAKDNSSKGGVKAFMSKLSGAFMLPISIMAVAGLFLGVGAAIASHTSAVTFGTFIKNLGDPIFGAMPALFMVAIVIAFTDEAGVGVFAGLIGFLIFNSLQIPFISSNGNGNTGTAEFLGIHTSADIQAKMYKVVGSNLGITSLNTSIFGGIVVGFVVSYLYNKFHQVQLPQMISFFGGKRFVAIIAILVMIPVCFIFLLIWPWVGLGFAYFGEYSGKVAGLDSFLFGFIERSLIPFGLHHVFYAPLWWTSAGGDISSQFNDWAVTHEIKSINGSTINVVSENTKLINSTVKNLLDITYKTGKGANSVTNNLFTESDITSILNTNKLNGFSFDTNHVLQYPKIFGDKLSAQAVNNLSDGSLNKLVAIAKTNTDVIKKLLPFTEVSGITNLNDVFIDRVKANGTFEGDSFGWLAVNGSGINNITYAEKTSLAKISDVVKVFPFISDQLGINFGRFMQGKFAFMQLGLPAAGVAMVMAAPKENRKEAMSVVFPAALTSFVTGVTEPIEFTFLFLAPILFWGFHATMAAFSFLFMNLLGAHVGMTFSGGFIDSIVYGMIPFSQGTNFYWMYAIGIIYAPIYYFVFLWYIKKFNLDTPGRGSNTKLFTKADFRNKKAVNKGGINPQGASIIKAAGGWDNIVKFANCATRLRYDIKSKSKVDEKALKAAGAAGVAWVGEKHIQIIMGPVAEQLNSNIKANIGKNLDMELKETVSKVKKQNKVVSTSKNIDVKSVTNGTVASLASLKDGVFSKKMMGDGVVVKFPTSAKKGEVFAPVSGELVTVFPTGHAYGIRTDEGIEILIHIGVDTVKLNGKGFKALVKQGAKIKAGAKMAEVDLATVRKEAPSADPIVLVTSGETVSAKATGKITKTSKLFTIK